MCPGANHRDISKIISKWWKEATPIEREPYIEKAAQEKKEHARRHPHYKYMPQKRSKTGTRTYKRRTHDEFTSKSKKLNDCMKQIYYSGDSSTLPPLPTSSSSGVQIATHAASDSDSPAMPTISVDSVPSSLSLSSIDNSAQYSCLLTMSSPSSSSLSMSLSSSSSPSYIAYSNSAPEVYNQLPHLSILDPSFLFMDDQQSFYTLPLVYYNTHDGELSSSMPVDMSHQFQTTDFELNDDMFSSAFPPLNSLCGDNQYYFQHPELPFDALVNDSLSPSPSIKSNFGCSSDRYDYSTQQGLYDQYQGQKFASPTSDFYMCPPSNLTLLHSDLGSSSPDLTIQIPT